jgi:hypothetical protein
VHLPTYDETIILTDVDITDDVVEHVAARLTGSAGLVALDAHAALTWLLRFGGQPTAPICGRFGIKWMANGRLHGCYSSTHGRSTPCH